MKRLLIFLLLICAAPAWGAQWYLRSGQTTADSTGADWTNAFNSSIKAESQMAEGDTLWVADGSYSYTNWNMSTRSGKVTYVIKATVAAHGTEDGWDNGYGDGQAIFTSTASVWWIDDSNYVFDGVSCTGDTTGYGFKLISTSTTSQYNTIQISGWTGTTGTDVVDSLTFKYIEVQGSGITNDYSTKLLYVEGIGDGGVSRGINIQYCYFHDSFQNHLLFRYNREVLVEHCVFNRHYSGTNHGESISDAYSDSVTIRYNKFIDCGHGTGVIVLENNPTIGSNYWDVYGNLFYVSHGNPFNVTGPGNGIFTTSDGIGKNLMTHCNFYNNTIVNYRYGGSQKCGVHAINNNANNLMCYNNLWYNCSGLLERPVDAYGWSGFNFLVNCTGTISPALLSTELSQSDSSGVFTDHLNLDFSLVGATALACSTLSSPFNVDLNDSIRGGDGYWDAGYLEYSGDLIPPSTTHTYYVHPDGGGAGTEASPFATIAAAEAAADQNDVIILDGTLNEKLTTPSDSITYRGRYNAIPPRIGGKKAISGFVTTAATVTDSITTPLQDGLYNIPTRNMSTAGTQDIMGYTNSGQIANGWFCFLVPALTNFSSWNSFKVRLFSLSNTGIPVLRIKTAKGYLKYTTQDTTRYYAMQAESASRDSVLWNDTDPAVNTWYFAPELASILPSLAENDTLTVLFNNESETNDTRINVEMTENANSNQARIYYEYSTTGGGSNPYVLVPAANRSFTRVWKGGNALTQAATHAALEAGKFYKSAAGDSLFLVAADTTGIEIDGFDTIVDYNEKRGITVRNIVVNGIGASGAAITMDGINGLLAHVFADSCSKAVYVNADSNRVLNNVISASDTAMIITPGKINIQHDYNGYTDKRPGDTTLPSKFIRREPYDRERRAA